MADHRTILVEGVNDDFSEVLDAWLSGSPLTRCLSRTFREGRTVLLQVTDGADPLERIARQITEGLPEAVLCVCLPRAPGQTMDRILPGHLYDEVMNARANPTGLDLPLGMPRRRRPTAAQQPG